MMHYIHGKEWDAKLLGALITDKACIKMLEIKCEKGILQALDKEKFFNKEGLKDALHIMSTKNISYSLLILKIHE